MPPMSTSLPPGEWRKEFNNTGVDTAIKRRDAWRNGASGLAFLSSVRDMTNQLPMLLGSHVLLTTRTNQRLTGILASTYGEDVAFGAVLTNACYLASASTPAQGRTFIPLQDIADCVPAQDQVITESEKKIRMAKFVAFSQTFKLRGSIPQNNVPILTKDSNNTKTIVDKHGQEVFSACAGRNHKISTVVNGNANLSGSSNASALSVSSNLGAMERMAATTGIVLNMNNRVILPLIKEDNPPREDGVNPSVNPGASSAKDAKECSGLTSAVSAHMATSTTLVITANPTTEIRGVLAEETETVKGTPAKTISQQQRGRAVVASSHMSLEDMFNCLLENGCLDFSSRISPSAHFRTPIAGGAFGDVYRGSLRDGTVVAIKVLRHHLLSEDIASKALKRAMRELYYWSKLKHDNVQELLGVIMLEGRMGMVSLWMPNGHLEEYLRKNPDANWWELSTQVASGVEYLHSVEMVHGDLKARNVLVDQNGTTKISDFDHSILSSCTLAFTETTNAGGGTVRWMAPELFLSNEEAGVDVVTRTKETDVYALGMTILEIITREHPFAEYRIDSAVIMALTKRRYPARPKGLESNRMWELLEHCWNHNRVARASVSIVCKELSNLGPKDLLINADAEE